MQKFIYLVLNYPYNVVVHKMLPN